MARTTSTSSTDYYDDNNVEIAENGEGEEATPQFVVGSQED